MVVTTPLTVVMLLTITVGVTAALMAWRERPEPGAVPLTAMLVGQSVWSILFIFELEAATLAAKVFWSNLQWIGVVIIPVAWLFFSLEYAGIDRYVRPRYIGVLSIVPVVTVGLAVTGDQYQLLYVDTSVVTANGLAMLDRVGGPWYWVITAYTYLLGVLGAIPLLQLIHSEAKAFRGQSAAILTGILAPGAINAIFLLGFVPITGFDPTPIGFAISGVAYLGALRRFRLFGTSPAPTQGAHRFLFDRMQEGALVVDSHDYVVDMNDSVADILGIEPREALGLPAADLIPRYETLPEEGQANDHLTIDGTGAPEFYDVNVTRVSDYHDRTVGKVITFHDIGQHLRQQQRLEVLNRVLRHNIRNEATLIYGYLDGIDDAAGEDVDRVRRHVSRIEELSEQARTIADLFEREEDGPVAVSLDRLLEESVDAVRTEYPAVDLECGQVPERVRVSKVFGPVLSNVVDNAAKHNTNPDPRVRIRCEREGDRLEVVVEDNGPGIGEYEREVLERGRETPLNHGSGLGLWLITWGTRIAGGDVTFDSNEPTGSVITLTVPALAETEASDRNPAIP